jgi:hypothetical protein
LIGRDPVNIVVICSDTDAGREAILKEMEASTRDGRIVKEMQEIDEGSECHERTAVGIRSDVAVPDLLWLDDGTMGSVVSVD